MSRPLDESSALSFPYQLYSLDLVIQLYSLHLIIYLYSLDFSHSMGIIYMNSLEYSDIKLAERFILDNSVYLLNMFQKKIDSFIMNRSNRREHEYLHPQHVIEETDQFFNDPVKNLSKDLTKPIWSCRVKAEPVIVLQQTEDNCMGNPAIECINHTLSTFFQRFKSEHEDESNLKVLLNYYSRNHLAQKHKDLEQMLEQNRHVEGWMAHVDELFLSIKKCNDRDIRFLQRQQEHQPQHNEPHFEDAYDMMTRNVSAFHDIIERYFETEEVSWQRVQLQETEQVSGERMKLHVDYLKGVFNFLSLATNTINSVLDQSISATVFCYYSQVKFLPLVIHPMLMAVYVCLKSQLSEKNEKKQSPVDIKIEQEKTHTVFEQLRNVNCSKVTFLNLDGYESDYNVLIAKYLSKYVQYISFPLQREFKDPELMRFARYESERFFHKHFSCEQEEDQLNQERLFQAKEEDMKRRLFVLPVHSIRMREGFEQRGVRFKPIQRQSSSYVLFMMRELIFNQIREFGPSIIIVSYSKGMGLEDSHFEEIVKQLTMLGNLRVMLYPNINNMHIFEEELPSNMIGSEDYFNLKKQAYLMQRDNYSLFGDNGNELNLDFFNKISIFLKVTSGTYSLAPQRENDSLIEKYRNSEIVGYVGSLFKLYSKDHPVIERMRMRTNEYQVIERVLLNYYHSDNFSSLFKSTVSMHHKQLIYRTSELLRGDAIISTYQHILATIQNRYGLYKQSFWSSFIFQYQLQLAVEKTGTKYYAHIPKFKEDARKGSENLMALQFEVIINKCVSKVEITSKCEVHYSSRRVHANTPIYLLNHLYEKEDERYYNYCGLVTPEFDHNSSLKVQLEPVIFEPPDLIQKHFHLVHFNHYESEHYIFLFWPQAYDEVEALLHQFAGENYQPKITNYIFMAKMEDPFVLQLVQPQNDDYGLVISRSGCTCFEVQRSNKIYIFGGFYTNQQNYLKFQTDITVISYDDSALVVENAPKEFHFDYQKQEHGNKITSLKNDFIRPRVEYEVYVNQEGEQTDGSEIFLIGGVGQKFMRPYSMIGYMAHKLNFNRSGVLLGVRRVKMNNIVPVNLSKPLRSPAGIQMSMVVSSENRSIHTERGCIPANAFTISRFNVVYQAKQQRFNYLPEYELAEVDRRTCRKELFRVQRDTAESQPLRPDLVVRVFPGKRDIDNFVIIFVFGEKPQRYLFNLHLDVSSEVLKAHPGLKKRVHLIRSSIIALDASNLHLYAIIRHPQYTLGRCVLAFADLHQFLTRENDSNFDISLKEAYMFERDMSHCVVKIVNKVTIAVLHGCNITSQEILPEIILKKMKMGGVKEYEVKPSAISQLSQAQKKCSIRTSFFLYQNGIVQCFTFKSMQIRPSLDLICLIMQQLDMTDEPYQWNNQRVNSIQFEYGIESMVNNKFQLIEMRYNQSQKAIYELIGVYQEVCYRAVLAIDKLEKVFFEKELPLDQYYKMKYAEKPKYQDLMLLQKTASREEYSSDMHE